MLMMMIKDKEEMLLMRDRRVLNYNIQQLFQHYKETRKFVQKKSLAINKKQQNKTTSYSNLFLCCCFKYLEEVCPWKS